MVLAPVKKGWVGEVDEFAVHARAHETITERALEEVAELALASPYEGGADLDAGAGGPAEDLLGDLRGRLRAHGAAARGTVGGAGAGPQEAEVVVDLGDGADGGARVAAGGALLDGDGGRESLDDVDVGLLHDAEELPGVGGEGFDVAALPLRVDGVEGERGLAGAGEPGDDDEPVARQFDVDVAKVVLPRPPHDERAAAVGRLGASGSGRVGAGRVRVAGSVRVFPGFFHSPGS